MTQLLGAGFAEPVLSSQSTFRAVMDAMARPGTITPIARTAQGPAPLSHSAAAIALSLLDPDTPVWLDRILASDAVAGWLRFHTGAPITADPANCAFALIGDPTSAPAFAEFQLGTSDYPDRSTTILFQVDSLVAGPSWTLAGPGIRGTQQFQAAPLPPDFAQQMAANNALFPRGIDLLFAADDGVAALPRTTRLIGAS